jgi:hypothetical protein
MKSKANTFFNFASRMDEFYQSIRLLSRKKGVLLSSRMIATRTAIILILACCFITPLFTLVTSFGVPTDGFSSVSIHFEDYFIFITFFESLILYPISLS